MKANLKIDKCQPGLRPSRISHKMRGFKMGVYVASEVFRSMSIKLAPFVLSLYQT